MVMTTSADENAALGAACPTNLPLQLTSFVGRVREVAHLQAWFSHAPHTGARLLTLIGPGGCGKTRLALQVASSLTTQDAFPDGIWLVELAPLADGNLVPQAIAAPLQIREQPSEPLITTLAHVLKTQRLLLVLDNCEHLIAACAILAESLLRACPALMILATSREALNIAGESLRIVPPLAIPEAQTMSRPSEPTELLQIDSIQLFVERAKAVQADFALTAENGGAVAKICQWLDGIPLAIELAAGRLKTLSAQEIAERLDDRFGLLTSSSRSAVARHQTLRAAVEWSYSLLAEQERTLLLRLAVFAGGWTLPAAEAICGAALSEGLLSHLSPAMLLDVLTQLVDKSLVIKQEIAGRARYFMLETIRQYAWEKLIASGEVEALQQQHAHFFLQLAEASEAKLNTAERSHWIALLAMEHDNLRGALRWALNGRATEVVLRMAGALLWFWHHLGTWREGRSWLDAALQLVEENSPTPPQAKALFGSGWLAFNQADATAARKHFTESLMVARATGAQATLPYALSFLALVMTHQGEAQAARPLADEGVALFRQGDDRWGLAIALLNRGVVAEALSEYALANSLFEESATIFQGLADDWAVSLPLRHMGTIALRQGETQRAQELYQLSLRYLRHLHDHWFVSMSLEELARLAVTQEQYERAARLLGAAEALRESIGAGVRQMYQRDYARMVEHSRSALGQTRFAALWAAGRALSMEAAIDEALAEPSIANPASIPAEVVARHEQEEHRAALSTNQVLTPLAIYAFGLPRVVRGDQLLKASDWGFAKPQELLFYLLTYITRTREQIGLALWPDASPAQLRNNLHTTLYHLRHALGHPDWILFTNRAYAFNRSLPYRYDVEQFEGHLADAKKLLKEPQNRTSVIPRLQAAIDLAAGDFAEGLAGGDWIVLQREALQRKLLEALLTLGQLHCEAQDYAEALQVYRQAIQHDNLLEEAHRWLMRCYVRMGERSQALRHYQSMRELLWEELGVEPASESVMLWQRIQRGDAV
jgi:predicted ATPase/DNA-binding SARP family transcriptional activator